MDYPLYLLFLLLDDKIRRFQANPNQLTPCVDDCNDVMRLQFLRQGVKVDVKGGVGLITQGNSSDDTLG